MNSSVATPTTIDLQTYRCPGERYTIDRSTHLGRLANFYSKCRSCPHRDDTATISKGIVKRLDQTHHRVSAPAVFVGNVLQGDVGQSLSVDLARNVAKQFGIWLQGKTLQDDTPKVILASDGRPLTAPLVAALSEGLAWAGCRVIDVGRVVVPAALDAQAQLDAHGTVTVGNAPGQPQTASIRLFGPQGCPLSTNGDHHPIQTMSVETLSRPGRHTPPAMRATADRSYLDRLQGYFHALRPLRFVLDTASPTVIDWISELLGQVACSAILLRGGQRYVGVYGDVADSTPDERTTLTTGSETSVGSLGIQSPRSKHSGSPREVARTVKEEAAHFGVAIDGDGHALEVWDETGRKLYPEELFLVLTTLGIDDNAHKKVVVPDGCRAKTVEALRDCEIDAVTSSNVHRALLEGNAILGLSHDGQLWHRNNVPMVDALQTLACLLAALSQSDRPLSTVVRQLTEAPSTPKAKQPTAA